MCDLTDFLEANPRTVTVRAVTDEEKAEMLAAKVPEEIISFLSAEGLSTYKNNFYQTTLPQWHRETFNAWGLKGKDCHALMRTAFGALFYMNKGKLWTLNVLTGNALKSDFDFCTFLNLAMTMDAIAEAHYFDIYEKHIGNTVLHPDEVLGLFPALPMGGSFETSKYEVVKMNEHIGFLAQLFNGKVRKL